MAGRVEGGGDAVQGDGLAVADRLRRAGEILAIAQPHDVEGFLRRQHGAVAGPGMVGMAMRDQRLVDRTGRVDVKAAGLAADAGRCRQKQVFGTHRAYIGSGRKIASGCRQRTKAIPCFSRPAT